VLIASNSRFVITSRDPSARLALRWTRPAYLEIVLEDQGLRAQSEIHAVVSGPDNLPTKFFIELAESWRGWRGTKDWQSYERDWKLSATADGKGHVFLQVGLAAGASDDQWRVQATLVLEAGQLEGYSQGFRAFSDAAPRAA